MRGHGPSPENGCHGRRRRVEAPQFRSYHTIMRLFARILFKVVLPFAVIGVAGWAVYMLYLTSPSPARRDVESLAPVVSVADLRPGSVEIEIEAFGTVVPAQQVELRAQVVGRIVERHPELVPGGVLRQDSEVLRIDPTDYVLRVRQEEVAIESARAQFELERGQQVVAAREWNLLKDDIENAQEMADFALRRPQQRMAQAQLEAAKNRLNLAQLDLDRTTLSAPLNALVLDEFVDVGQLVTSQMRVANLVGTDRFWVRVSVPLNRLGRIRFANSAGDGGSRARVYVDTGGILSRPREAHVVRLLGSLSERGRMARLLLAIDDPLNLGPDADPDAEPILLESYVRVVIDAGVLDGVCEIPRAALRENDRVWVRDADGLLQIRDVDILWRRRDTVLIKNNFSPNEKLITSRLAMVLPGMPVRTAALPGADIEAHAEKAVEDETATDPTESPGVL